MKKYKLTDETINVYGITLFRIEAVISFGDIKKGEKGGYIEKEENLSNSGNARIYGNAWVYSDARVYGNARVSGDARVYGNAWVYSSAWVSGNARVYGNAIICNTGCSDTKSYLTIGPLGSDRFITLERSCDIINAGCFSGTIDAFEAAVKEKYGDESDYYPVIAFLRTIKSTEG